LSIYLQWPSRTSSDRCVAPPAHCKEDDSGLRTTLSPRPNFSKADKELPDESQEPEIGGVVGVEERAEVNKSYAVSGN
jgi:hypothetical protein